MGLYRRLVSFAERVRPGFLVPKGAVFVAKLMSQNRIEIPEEVRKKLRLEKGEMLEVFFRLEPLRLNPLQRIVYRIRPGIFFPKGYHFNVTIDTSSWRFTVPDKLLKNLESNNRPLKEGDKIEVYIRRFGETI